MASLVRQRDTPNRSSFSKASQTRSTQKPSRQDLGLQLERVLGTTCSSPSRFDINPTINSFAYVAGAATVLTTVNHDLSLTQRFFRANATQNTTRPPSNGATVNPQDFRSRLGRETRAGSPFASSGQSDLTDSPGGGSGHARDKVKAATAVAISKNGKLLAYGETGYRPRVLLFPITEKSSTDTPLAIISEHSFGVQAVAFDGEGKLLATLGVINDGFLYIWEIDPKTSTLTLLAANKCTTPIRQMAWIGRSLVTVGLRCVKVWRPDEVSPSSGHDDCLSNPAHKPLVGRNALLGDMLEANFTAVVPASDSMALICSDAGDICVLDDTDKQQKLVRVDTVPFSITAACRTDAERFSIAGSDAQIVTFQLPAVLRSDTPLSRSSTPTGRKLNPKAGTYAVAIGTLGNTIVSVATNHSVHFHQITPQEGEVRNPASITSHWDAVLGVRAAVTPGTSTTSFVTWSCDGMVYGWSDDSQPTFALQVPMEAPNDPNDMMNDLKTIFLMPDSKSVITGDRYGMLRIMNIADRAELYSGRAHDSEISDISVYSHNDTVYVATASRDRTVQLFTWTNKKLELVQTLDEHAGAVMQVSFTSDGKHLLSSSTDRTIVIRERVLTEDGSCVYVPIRTVNLKSAPTAISISNTSDRVLVSAMDRTVSTISISTGKIVSSFKAGDLDGGDTVPLSDMVRLDLASGPLIAGVSTVDKSIRLYTEDGTLLSRDWGHTEGVTGIALLPSAGTKAPRLVTVAADGTVFIWALSSHCPTPPKEDTPTSTPLSRPLRKVISMSEISRMRRSLAPGSGTDSEPVTPIGRVTRLSVARAPKLTPGKDSPASPTRSPSPVRPPLSPTRSSPSKLAEASRKALNGSPRTPRGRIEPVHEEQKEIKSWIESLKALRTRMEAGGVVVMDQHDAKELLKEVKALGDVLAVELGKEEDRLEKAMGEVRISEKDGCTSS